MKFLILGGSGYLGSKIVKRLIVQGHELVCIIRPKSDLYRLKDVEGITYVLNEEKEMRSLQQAHKFDWILNLACCYGRGCEDNLNVIEGNLLFPLRVLDLAMSNKANILTIGTGLPNDINLYSFTKSKFAEFGRFFSQKENINFINLKVEMFYGSDEPENRFLPGCIGKLANGHTVDLTDGFQRRDIVSVEDVVEAILFLINFENQNIRECFKQSGYQEFSVGTGEGPRIRDVIQYMKEYMNSNSVLNFGAIPNRAGERDCVGHPEELERLGFRYQYPWRMGIEKMIREMVGERE